MAKVKTAKQKIVDYLKAKEYDAEGIKEVLAELDAADVDLEDLAKANDGWKVFWYQQAAPEMETAVKERDELKARIEKLKAAGFGTDPAIPDVPKPQGGNQYVTPEQLQEFQNKLARASSDTMKSITKYGIRHFNKYKEELDLDAVEKLMGENGGRSIDDAYRIYEEPKRVESEKKEREEAIAKGVREGIQAELSKRGPVRSRKVVDEDIPKVDLTDKKSAGPSDRDLRDAFLNDLNSIVTH